MAVLASVSAVFLATSSAPTPLYGVYATSWGLSAAQTSLVFGAYAFALLSALLVLGRFSEHVGRRTVIRHALLVQVVAMLVFAAAEGVTALLVGRVLQGLSTGAGLAAVGAALLDTDADTGLGRVVNAAAPPVGSAIGALASGLLVAYAPLPTRLIYLLLAVVLLIQIAALALVSETAPRTPGVLSSLRPGLRAPQRVRAPLGAAIPVLFAVWAVSGLFGAFGPDLTEHLTGSSSPVLATLPFVIVGAVAPVTAFCTTALRARSALAYGITGLLSAVALTGLSLVWGQAWLLLVGASLAGGGFGVGFRGGMDLVLPAVGEADRAGTLALLYTASYMGFGVPAIVAGLVLQHTRSLPATTLGYCGVVALLGLTAAGFLRKTARHERTAP
ncbi:MFS transporter [Streptomyces sp. NPDC008313]|uniref:MFS transporter n=1 Tax=Streptomyces sp. NPDC008313 TaxID=3364826 RepID=UPI0036EFC4D6